MVDVAARGPARLHFEELRFLVFGRALPAVLFALLGYRVLLNLVAQVHGLPNPPTVASIARGPLPTALYFCFCSIPVAIYLGRPRARAHDGRLVARCAAFTGTLMLIVVGALPAPNLLHLPSQAEWVATPLAILAFALAVYGLVHLRRNLSIIPEARSVVTSGPYRLIRHPLYGCEILAALATVLARPGLWAVVAFGPYVAVQITRANFEENLLSRTFAQYREYARGTYRLVPFIW